MVHRRKTVFLFSIGFLVFSGLSTQVSYGEALKDQNAIPSTVIRFDITAGIGAKASETRLTLDSQARIFDTFLGLQVKSQTDTFTLTPIKISEAWLNRRFWGFDVTAGRKFIRWGPGRYGTLLLSDDSPAFDLLRVEGNLGPIRFDEFTALVDASKSKYFFGHRLEIKPFNGLRLGIGETALAAGDFTGWLFNPIPFWPYYLTQYLNNKVKSGYDILVNIGVGLDAEYTAPNDYRLYGEYLVDDKPQYAGDNVPERTGYLVGFQIPREALDPKVSFGAEYARLNYYTYSHRRRETDYLHEGKIIGHWLGPDADDLQLEVRYYLDPRKTFGLTLERERHGEGRVGMPWNLQNGKDKVFLVGVVETTHRIKLDFDYQYSPKLLLSVGGSLGQVENQGNVLDQSGLENALWLQAKWLLNL